MYLNTDVGFGKQKTEEKLGELFKHLIEIKHAKSQEIFSTTFFRAYYINQSRQV